MIAQKYAILHDWIILARSLGQSVQGICPDSYGHIW